MELIKSGIFVIILFHNMSIYSQEPWSSSSKKAIQHIEKGLQEMNLGNYASAEEYFNQAIKSDKKFPEAYLSLGQLFEYQNEYDKASEYYKAGHELNPGQFSQTLMSIGRVNYLNGNYEDGKKYLDEYLSQPNSSAKGRERAANYLNNCDFALNAKKNPMHIEPINLGDSINTSYNDYWPSISADEQILVFTSHLPYHFTENTGKGFSQEDFFISTKEHGVWSKAKNMGPPINTPDNEGAQSLSCDGKTIFFTACNRDDGEGRCDILYSIREGDQWSEPKNMGPPINTKYNEKQPSILPDGRTLYFVSNRPDGMGKQDIWKSELNKDGYWGNPVNLGDSINSPEDETAPFIHPDNQTLYFTSNGFRGFGGNDLFVSRKLPDNSWKTAQNMGYPLNTPHDEMGLVVSASGKHAYYSTNMNKEKGLDIFMFDMPVGLQPKRVSYMKGIVFDADTREKLMAAFQLINLNTGDTLSEAWSDKMTGEFLITIPTNQDYALNVTKKGYLFYSVNFSFQNIHSNKDPLIQNIALQAIRLNKSVVLNNVFFETDAYHLKNESKIELQKVYEFLSLNPKIKVEIGGHTDMSGKTEYNLKLSQKRAEEVTAYLVELGIEAGRLVSKGYGEKHPVEDNSTGQGRAANRRTELKIIKIN